MFWILLIYLLVAYFVPEVGVIAIVCMVGPVAMAVRRGRFWCGHYCPRGSFFDKVISRISLRRPMPQFLRSRAWRIVMLCVIFGMFGMQIYLQGFTLAGVGRAFWNIILVTTLVGVALGFVYTPRTWCTFCPMGTLSAWVAPRSHKCGLRYVYVAAECRMRCKSCAKVCPMGLKPYESRGDEQGFLHPDCIKCGNCVAACPTKVMAKRRVV